MIMTLSQKIIVFKKGFDHKSYITIKLAYSLIYYQTLLSFW